MDRRTESTIIVVGEKGIEPNFETMMKSARGYLFAAKEIYSVHHRRMTQTPKGVSLGPEHLNNMVGRISSATILMALALEIVLKAKVLLFTGDINKTHDHAKLFSKFPDREKEAAEARYTRLRHPAMRQTLVEALSYSATVFVKWRYMHEVGSVEASGGEMLAAFSAIADDL